MTDDQVHSLLSSNTPRQLAVEVVRLTAESQQIREERDAETQRANENIAVYDDLKRRFDSGSTGLLAGVELIRSLQAQKEQAEAKTQALREALEKLKRGDNCWCEVGIGNPMMRGEHSAVCLQLQRLTPASPRTGSDICWCRKNPCVCLKHDAECETELTSHGYTPCQCAERAVRTGEEERGR